MNQAIELLEKARIAIVAIADQLWVEERTKESCILHEQRQAITTALTILKQQPPASEWTKDIREKLGNDPDPSTAYHWERLDKYWLCRNLFKLCDIIDRAEASNKNILTACEKVDEWLQKNVPATKRPAWLDKLLIDAIAQSKQSVTPEAHKE